MAILLADDPSHNESEGEGGSWYYIRKDIEENSPSKRDGIDLKRENYLRKSYCTFLQDLGIRLKVPQVTIATAIIFCHRFFLRQSHAKSDRRTIATACMFLAGKVEETPRPLKDVILVSYEIIHKEDPEAVQRIKQKEVYEKQKQLITLGEKVLLATLGFDLYVLNPYKPLVEAIKKFKVAQNALAQVAWNFVNDGLRTSLCLQFKPHHIAAGAIFLAGKFLKVKLPSDGEKVWWQEIDVTPHQLEEVSNQMLELYEQNQVPPSQCSEVGESARAEVNHRAPSSNEELATSTSRPGTLKPASSKLVSEQPFADTHDEPPRTSQSRSNNYGNVEMRSATDQNAYGEAKDNHYPELETLPYQNNREAHNTSRLGEEERNVLRSETREVGEFKDIHVGRNLDYSENKFGHSPQDAIKKIDRDKVKAALEKRKKFRGDFTRKTDLMDDDDLIERELEGGIELAAESEKNKEDRRQSWSRLSDRQEYEHLRHGEHHKDAADGHRHIMKGQSLHRPDEENVEEGQVSVPDETGRSIWSPKSSNRKRKGGSPPVKVAEGRQRHNYGSGSHHYNHHHFTEDRNRVRRPGYIERDHKRHALQNHV